MKLMSNTESVIAWLIVFSFSIQCQSYSVFEYLNN